MLFCPYHNFIAESLRYVELNNISTLALFSYCVVVNIGAFSWLFCQVDILSVVTRRYTTSCDEIQWKPVKLFPFCCDHFPRNGESALRHCLVEQVFSKITSTASIALRQSYWRCYLDLQQSMRISFRAWGVAGCNRCSKFLWRSNITKRQKTSLNLDFSSPSDWKVI